MGRITGPVLILLAAAIAVTPLLLRGPSCGHDFDFHLVSWLDANHSWRQGILYPHWTPSANYGAGEPRFVFYPPLTWMLGAALGLILPWTLVPAALTFFMLAATGLATRALARSLLREAPSTLAGCTAIFSLYTIFCSYERTAYGELAGGLWMPLLLLYALRRRSPAAAQGSSLRAGFLALSLDGSAVPLALVLAGAWLSNLPLGVMAAYLLAFAALAGAVLNRSFAPLVRAVVATALGLGLAGFYLIPAAYEQRWVNVSQATDDPGERIENSFLFAHHADPALVLHDIELRKVSVIATVLLVLGLAAIVLAGYRGAFRKTAQSAFAVSWLPLALILAAILFLQLPLSLPVWNLLPKLRFLQFPWRWLVGLGAPLGVFVAAAVWPPTDARPWRRWSVALGGASVFLAVTVYAGCCFYQSCDEEDNVRAMVDLYASGAGFAGTDEYAPPNAQSSARGLPVACLVDDPQTDLGVPADDPDAAPIWQAEQKSCKAVFTASNVQAKDRAEDFSLHAIAPRAGFLVLRLRSYPAWRILLNGHAVSGLPRRDDGLIVLPVQQGPVHVTADWTATADRIAGRWVTVLALAAITALGLYERKLSRSHLS